MPNISHETSRSLKDYIVLPGETKADVKVEDIPLESRVTDEVNIQLPFLSAAMAAVSGAELGIALAQHGGLAVIPCGSVTIDEQVEMVSKVKRYKAGFVYDIITLKPKDKISGLIELEKECGYSTFPVVDNGKLVGLITEKRYHPTKDLELEVRERMIPLGQLVVAQKGVSLSEANEIMFESGIGVLPIVDKEHNLNSVVFFSDYKKHKLFPNEFVDDEKRLRVAAAVSTHSDDIERAEAVLEAGTDFLFIDASDGFSEYQTQMIQELKKLKKPVWAGNVVTKEGFNYLANAGADGIKVGQGSGSICTTRRVVAHGRGQATAVMECSRARDEYFEKTGKYIPVCSDGGIENTGDMIVAFALGADLIMMGKYFAGFTESPTPITQLSIKNPDHSSSIPELIVDVKPYWGEASARGKNLARYGTTDPRSFVIEGVEGYVLHKGSIHKVLPRDISAIKRGISESGFGKLSDFIKNARVELQTLSSYEEGGTNILVG